MKIAKRPPLLRGYQKLRAISHLRPMAGVSLHYVNRLINGKSTPNPLTKQESAILRLLAADMSNHEIARTFEALQRAKEKQLL